MRTNRLAQFITTRTFGLAIVTAIALALSAAFTLSASAATATDSGASVGALSENSAPENGKAAFRSAFAKPLVWRGDAPVEYSFKNLSNSNISIAADGSAASSSSEASCELTTPYNTEAPVTELVANWSFTGKVTMEVSVTGSSRDYMKVTNGVPAHYQKSARGDRIKWRATIAPNSALAEVRISYSDAAGLVGGFGSELLSGFSARRQIYIKGSTAGELFNYQMPIKIGESGKSAAPCDIRLNAGILADFADIRFTQADGETPIPYYLEEVTGLAPDRVAYFWLRIPQIPKTGLPIYVYYGKALAADLSDANKVFEFFDDFNGTVLDPKKWKVTLYDKEAGRTAVADSALSLSMAKVTSAEYKFASGLIEYKAGASTGGGVNMIIRSAASESDDLTAGSSITAASAHAISKGLSVKENDPRPIVPGAFYTYRIYSGDDGAMAFRRYDESGTGTPQAGSQYSAGTSSAMPIGLSPSGVATEAYYKWIRVRQAVLPPPRVDDTGVSSGAIEAANLPEFYNVATALDGSLISADGISGGYYISKLISPGFEARILKASWEKASGVSVGVSTKKGGEYYKDWENGKRRYASKKEFAKGAALRFKVTLPTPTSVIATGSAEGQTSVIVRRPQADDLSSEAQPERFGLRAKEESISSFALEYYPGNIRVVLPNGKETIAPGSNYIIFWSAEGYGAEYPMEISYANSSKMKFKVIAPKISNTGDYSWNVPNEVTDEAFVKVADSLDKAVFGVSERYFTITKADPKVEAPVEAEVGVIDSEIEETEAVTTAVEEKLPVEKRALYEMLVVMPADPSDPAQAKRSYAEGDIVMIKPAGYLWGKGEREKFMIVEAMLTEKEAVELTKPKEIIETDKSGKKTVKIVAKRKSRLNLTKASLESSKSDSLRPARGKRPVVKSEMTEEKK